MIIGRVKEDFKEYCKKIDEKKKIALPMSILEFTGVMNRDWKTIGENIFNSREQNGQKRRIKNHKSDIK